MSSQSETAHSWQPTGIAPNEPAFALANWHEGNPRRIDFPLSTHLRNLARVALAADAANRIAFVMLKDVASALRALLERLIDYAGTFPPATLSQEAAVASYQRYRQSQHAWMLRWLVVGKADLDRVPSTLDGTLAVLTNADEPRAASIESKQIVSVAQTTYCEVSMQALDDVKRAGCFTKIRTGGITSEAIPSVDTVAAFILACADRKLAFKATAGLHHPIRAMQPLTYESNAPRAVMHGFLNVFLAAAFAWHGQRAIEPLLAEMEPSAFHFDERAHWRDWSLDVAQIRDARTQFAHAFGSCSFEEPIRDLEGLSFL